MRRYYGASKCHFDNGGTVTCKRVIRIARRAAHLFWSAAPAPPGPSVGAAQAPRRRAARHARGNRHVRRTPQRVNCHRLLHVYTQNYKYHRNVLSIDVR
eukprot:4005216-Pleurochrysis_carterae.AAC.1